MLGWECAASIANIAHSRSAVPALTTCFIATRWPDDFSNDL
jgi:hypothetical protein